MKSASEKLHNLLMENEVGFKFTKDTLGDMAVTAGMDLSEGSITGFIYRAIRLGRVQYAGKIVGEYGRKMHQYEIVDREPWVFKAKGHGSYKGRKIGERQYKEVPESEPMSEPEKETIKLSDRLFDLATELEAFEKKSLKDYSTDELIAELKTRVR